MSATSVTVVVPRGGASAAAAIERYLETTGFTFEVLVPAGEHYASALRRGVSDAKGGVIVIVDPELPYPVSAIGDAVAMIESGTTDIVFASTRADYQAARVLRWLLVPILPDPSICLSAFSSSAAKVVVGESRLDDRRCELEVAFLANKYGFRIERLVVQSTSRRPSFGAIDSIPAAISVRIANRRNAYRAARRCPVCFSPAVWTAAQIPGNVIRACRRCKCRYLNQFADDEGANPVRRVLRPHATAETETPAYECEFRVRHRNGHWVWLLSRGKVVERDEFGIAVRMTGTHMDLTRRKEIEAQMERSASLLKQTGELAQIGGWELDLATSRLDWTEQVWRIHELEPGGPMPSLDNAIDFFAPEAQAGVRSAISAGARDGRPWDLELPFVTAKGNPRWVRMQGIAAIAEGRPVRLLGAFQDITEKKTTLLEMHRLNEQLTRLSTTDALTEVGNRRMFDQTLKTEWARASRRGEPLGLLMIDIDHFKEYNDHYGHPAGDACLRQVARMVGQSMRRGGELVARYGGEEFALLLPGADLDDTRRAAERCAQIVADAKIEHRASATSAWLTISIGAASQIAVPGTDGSGLVETADAALYRAKRCGRARIEF